MSDSITSESGSLSPGQIEFFDSIQPPLGAGDYTLKAEQEVKDIPGETVPPYTAKRAFHIDGPQFKLDPNTIHAVFPPNNQEGAYFNVLPHIVFNNFSLPWARNINPASATPDGTPWMGVLTIYEQEMPDGSAPKMSAPATVTVDQLVNPPSGTLGPCLDAAGSDSVLAVDLDLDFFQAISPSLAELQLLAHSRSVDTSGKVLLDMPEDGCFSVAVGNRVAENGGNNLVLLVSLEGHQDHLHGSTITNCDGSTPGTPFTKIRFAVLANWSFKALEMPGSFIALMADLCKQGGVKLLGLPPSEETKENDLAKEALEIGYIGLQNNIRDGEQTTSWYRGPFSPTPTKRDFEYGPYHFADHAIHYDPEQGLFDLSYAAAWQIGALLALSDGVFAQDLFEWRRDYFRRLAKAAVQAEVGDRLARSFNTDQSALASTLRKTPNLVDHMGEFFRTRVAPLQGALPGVTVRHKRGRALPGVLTEVEEQRLFDSGEDPLTTLIQKIKKRS